MSKLDKDALASRFLPTPSSHARLPRDGEGASSLLPLLAPAWTPQGKRYMYAGLVKVCRCSVALHENPPYRNKRNHHVSLAERSFPQARSAKGSSTTSTRRDPCVSTK